MKPKFHNLFVFVFLSLFSAALPAENVKYTDRPDILEVTPAQMREEDSPAKWKKHRKGILNFVAQLNALYPNDPIYFLARDGEYAYDMAKILHQDDKAALRRFKLINVSSPMDGRDDSQKKVGIADRERDNHPKTANLAEYLEQEGISERTLRRNRVILVDTGFDGTIATLIGDHLPAAVRPNVLMHMVENDNGHFPSSRVYLSQASKRIRNAPPLTKHAFGNPNQPQTDVEDFVNDLEEFPHWSQSATQLRRMGGRIVPVTSYKEDEAGSDRLMADIRRYGELAATKESYREILGAMTALTEGARGERVLTRPQIQRHLDTLEENDVFGFGMDLKEAQMIGYVPLGENALEQFWERMPQGEPRLTKKEAPRKNLPKGGKNGGGAAKEVFVLEDAVGQTFEVGEQFKLPDSNRIYTVDQDLNGGKDRNVYKIHDDRGRESVIKISSAPQYTPKIQNEIDRATAIRQMRLAAPPITHQGEGFIIRDWQPGTRGDAWLRQWNEGGLNPRARGWTKLRELLEASARAGKYIGKLDPEDMMWDGQNWHIIDSGGVRDDLAPNQIARRYAEKMAERWGEQVNAVPTCQEILAPLAQLR